MFPGVSLYYEEIRIKYPNANPTLCGMLIEYQSVSLSVSCEFPQGE